MSALRAVSMGDHAEHGIIRGAAMERAMKVQDVMLQAMTKKITWRQAVETRFCASLKFHNPLLQ